MSELEKDMNRKTLPFGVEQLREMADRFGTPFHLYMEEAIRNGARLFNRSFSWHPRFRQYFAVKATPNPFIMQILAQEGCGMDCSSLAELYLADKCGIRGERIMFSSNDTPREEFVRARELDAIVNLDDITHIDDLDHAAGLPEILSFRYNPGPLRGGNAIIGVPQESKYGFTREQIFEGCALVKDRGVDRIGLHTMVVSNELNPQSYIDTAAMMFELAVEVGRESGMTVDFVNLGGGLGIPYRPEDQPIDLDALGSAIHELWEQIVVPAKLGDMRLFTECGRIVTGPYGYLVSRVRHVKKTYKTFVGLDACMADLMRPALYNAYHHVSVPGKEEVARTLVCDLTGSLCENNDKFAVNRPLPPLERGDLVVLHDTGAHGHAMGFNYNGKLRSQELLLKEDGSVVRIRRAETIADYIATLDFSGIDAGEEK